VSLVRAFGALTGASAVSMAAQLVRGKLAALLLGPAGVGVFNQLSLMWNLFQIGGSLGSANGIIQHGAEALAAKDEAALRRLASTSALLLGAIACLLAAAGVLAAPWLSALLLDDGGAHADLVRLILLSVPLGVTGQVYRALLSSGRAVRELVRTQIASDVGGAIVFALLIVPLGLAGAVLGFMATHLLLLVLAYGNARRKLGARAIRPRLRDFSWAVVRSNIGFGASGLIMIALSNLSVLFVGRLVIEHLGIEANGIFSNAWRIASVYLGAVTATTIAYYLPTVTRCETAEAMGREVNGTLRFYLYALPLLMTGIMTLGEPLVWLILSKQFLPVAPLLLIFVPAELLRIMAETLSVPFLARKRTAIFTWLYVLQAMIFMISALVLLPRLGLAGAAVAYAGSAVAGAIVTGIACRAVFGIGADRATAVAFLRAIILLGGAGLACAMFPIGVERLAIVGLLAILWLAMALRDEAGRAAMRRLKQRFSSPAVSEAGK
jgi:antigen flippase